MQQITRDDPEFASVDVAISDTVIRKDLIIAADAGTGKVWCWQIDETGTRLKTVELKTGSVTIRAAKT